MRSTGFFHLRRTAWAAVFFALSSLLAFPQGEPTYGTISGSIAAADGKPVSGAAIRATSESGTQFSTSSDNRGRFLFLNLASGSYSVAVSAPGFTPWRTDSVVVAVGRNAPLTISLSVRSANQTVTVSAETSSLDPTQTSPVANIDKDRIEELPIASRNYLNFALLAPETAAANPAIAQQSLTPQNSGFSFGGLRPNSNAVYIDGSGDNDEFTGSPRVELSPEAVSDFQIVNHGYSAESGGAMGGSIDVESRSGANLRHGDAFLFVQNGALNADPSFDLLPHRPDENRLRAGLSQGGALRRDRSFYYVAAEQEMARGEDANDLCPATLTALNNGLRRGGPLSDLNLSGGFLPTTDEETELSGRLDQNLGKRTALMLRYSLTNNRAVNDAFNNDDLTDNSARGSAFTDDNMLNGSLTTTLPGGLSNRIDFAVAMRRVALRTLDASTPGVLIPGVVQFGTPFAGNSARHEVQSGGNEDVLWQRGSHLLQAGVGLNHVGLRAQVQDGFHGLYVFPSIQDLAQGNAVFSVQSAGDSLTNFGVLRTAAYVQDHWMATHQVTVDYGLRYDDTLLPSSLPQHALNFAPRLGVAWSPQGNWVFRSGFGLFYDRYQLGAINRVLEFDGTHAAERILEGDAAAAAWLSGTPAASAPDIWRAQPGMKNPYSEVASLGAEHNLGDLWTAKLEYQLVNGVHLGRSANINLPPPAPYAIARTLVFPASRLNPAYDAVNQFATEAHSSYNGATFTLNRQFTEEFELMAGYTWSKTLDDASYDSEQPQNPYNLRAERSLSLNDQRQRLTVSGLWVLGPDLDDPQDRAKAATPGPLMRAVTGLEFAPILEVNSGFRANPLTGFDTNAEHIYPFAARPVGFSRNSLKTPPYASFDLRILRMVPIWRGHLDVVAESFNLLNHTDIDLLNTTFGNGTQPQPGFRSPTQAADARRIQFSLDYEY